MMGERQVMQEALFYGFSLERHVPSDHFLRKIDRFVDLSEVRAHLEPYYSEVGRPSIDPELMIRMLIVGYCFGVRSERRLCEEVHLNLAYRWFCRLGLDGGVPDHSTFSKNRHGRFRESDLLRKLFETVVARCMKERLVGGEAFAVDASMIVADAYRRRGVAKVEDLDPTSSRAVAEYLSVLDDAAFGGASPSEPKAISPVDPAARYTAAANTAAVYAYSDNYLVDLKHAVIVDVEATTAIRQAEVGAAKTMLDRTAEQFDVRPSRLVADAGYGSAEMLSWLVDERGIEPHVKVFDHSERKDGTFSRADFAYDAEANVYVCPGGKELKKYHRNFSKPREGLTKAGTLLYFARKHDCDACPLKPKCCPNMPARKISRSIHEAARDKARAIAQTAASPTAQACGCPKSRTLKVSDIDSQRMRLRVEQGKGQRDRYVMLSPQLLELLRDWWRAARPRAWLFPGQNLVNPMSSRQLGRAVHNAASLAGIAKRVSPHTLRHSFATHLLEQNVDIRVIQVLLGHAKLETTALYTRVAVSTIREVKSPLERLGVNLASRSPPA